MRRIYFDEELSHDDVMKIQDETQDKGWFFEKYYIPAERVLTARQWAKNAEEWMRKHCVGSWVGMAYLDERRLYLRFENEGEAEAFASASVKF